MIQIDNGSWQYELPVVSFHLPLKHRLRSSTSSHAATDQQYHHKWDSKAKACEQEGVTSEFSFVPGETLVGHARRKSQATKGQLNHCPGQWRIDEDHSSSPALESRAAQPDHHVDGQAAVCQASRECHDCKDEPGPSSSGRACPPGLQQTFVRCLLDIDLSAFRAECIHLKAGTVIAALALDRIGRRFIHPA